MWGRSWFKLSSKRRTERPAVRCRRTRNTVEGRRTLEMVSSNLAILLTRTWDPGPVEGDRAYWAGEGRGPCNALPAASYAPLGRLAALPSPFPTCSWALC